MLKTTIIALTALCFLLPALSNAGTIFKWKDAKGSWHFSDTPPLQHEVVKNLKTSKYTPTKETAADRYNQAVNNYTTTTSTDAFIAQQTLAHKIKRNERKYKHKIEKINDEYNERAQARYKANIKNYKTKARNIKDRERKAKYNRWADEEAEKLKIQKKYHH